MWYGLAAVRHQHMPGQCALFGKDEVVVVRDAPDEKEWRREPSSAWCYGRRSSRFAESVIAGAVFSESMLASAYACEAMYCMQATRPGMLRSL